MLSDLAGTSLRSVLYQVVSFIDNAQILRYKKAL